MSVGEICSRVVDTAEAHETVADVAERMRDSKVGSMPVVDQDGRLVGMVTDRDLVLRVLAERREAQVTRVMEVMSECLQTVREDASIEIALAAMRKRSTRRLPVVDANDKFVGILALDDVLALLAEEFGVIGKVLAAEAPRPLSLGLVPEVPSREAAPVQRRRPTIPSGKVDLGGLERTLAEIRASLEVVACALSLGLETRMLGGGVIEADVRAAAERRLREILGRMAAPSTVNA